MKKELFIDQIVAQRVGDTLGINWRQFTLKQFQLGLNEEFGHDTGGPETEMIHDEVLNTGKIALAHLLDFPEYYSRLAVMNKEADEYWANV